jgi:type II secretory pathway pseudopilin PulG
MSLLEVLIAVSLLGIAVAGTLPLISAGIFGSGLQDRFAGARRWIVSAGDYATSASLPRIACTSSNAATILNTYQAALQDPTKVGRPNSFLANGLTVTQVQFWNGTTFTSTCVEPTQPTLTLQQISLRVVSSDGRVTETLDVVKGG